MITYDLGVTGTHKAFTMDCKLFDEANLSEATTKGAVMETITGVTLEGRALAVMEFLHRRVFDPALASPKATKSIRAGVLITILRMEQRRTANAMIKYFWAAVYGTEKSIRFADMMAAAGLDRFEEVLEEFRRAFPIIDNEDAD